MRIGSSISCSGFFNMFSSTSFISLWSFFAESVSCFSFSVCSVIFSVSGMYCFFPAWNCTGVSVGSCLASSIFLSSFSMSFSFIFSKSGSDFNFPKENLDKSGFDSWFFVSSINLSAFSASCSSDSSSSVSFEISSSFVSFFGSSRGSSWCSSSIGSFGISSSIFSSVSVGSMSSSMDSLLVVNQPFSLSLNDLNIFLLGVGGLSGFWCGNS